MLDEEVKELRKDLREILVAIGRLDEQVKNLTTLAAQLQDTMTKVALVERETIMLEGRIRDLENANEARERSSKEDRKWLLGAIISAISLIVAIWSKFERS